jgi:hypothetical protein
MITKRYLKFALLLMILTATGYSQFRTQTNNAFSYGERLSFEVSYGFITAAEAFMTISPAPFMYNNRETYEVKFTLKL